MPDAIVEHPRRVARRDESEARCGPGADRVRWLHGVHDALRPGGTLVFETRDPAYEGWRGWTREASYSVTEVPDVGRIQAWVQVTEVALPLVRFRSHWVFDADGVELTSDSTLRFRTRSEVERSLVRHRYVLDDVRGAPDRPGRELVFLAHRPR